MKINNCLIVMVLMMVIWKPELAVAVPDYFPTTPGRAWTYDTEALTLSGQNLVMKSGVETVQVLADGRFKNVISLENGNTVESYTSYVEQNQALSISTTRIIITTVDLPLGSTETTTVNTYSPFLLAFPADTSEGTHEISTVTQTTNLTGFIFYPPYSIPMEPSTTTSQHNVSITVGAVETVTVPAGTFSALKIVTTVDVTEDGQTSTTTLNEWFASGVGLVKLASSRLNRQLTSWSGENPAPDTATLEDAIVVLKMLAGENPANLGQLTDADGDGKIGMAEAVFTLRKIVGL